MYTQFLPFVTNQKKKMNGNYVIHNTIGIECFKSLTTNDDQFIFH